jgi:hypothetical protein
MRREVYTVGLDDGLRSHFCESFLFELGLSEFGPGSQIKKKKTKTQRTPTPVSLPPTLSLRKSATACPATGFSSRFAVRTPPKPARRRRAGSHAILIRRDFALLRYYSSSPTPSHHAVTCLGRWLRPRYNRFWFLSQT